MPDSLRLPARLRPMVAAARAYTPQTWRDGNVFHLQSWQAEAWGFRRTLGEFNQAVDWQSRAMSQIRLLAAEIVPGGDEPEILEDGPAAQLVQDFCGGGPGHSAFLKAITPHLLIPGEGWLIAERESDMVPLSAADWGVFSTDCVQVRGDRFWVRVAEARWRPLLPDALPVRVYEPDPQWPWFATSNAEAAVPIMRRIFLIDSRIIAMMVSRLAMNGLLLIPQEGAFSVPEQYMEAPDPFVAMLIDIASKNIQNPGNASAGIPIPIKFTGDLIDKWKILKADDPLDEWLLKERLDELGRLGDTLGISRERVSGGMSQANHWCVDDQTEILTASGWRRHDGLTLEDDVLTLNHNTGLAEWQQVEAINQWQVDNEPMVEIERAGHSSLTTFNHRWPVLRDRTLAGVARLSREWVVSADLGEGHKIVTAAPGADVPAEAKYADDLVELVAWFWTEGNISQSGTVTIAQSHTRNPARVDRIRACLHRMFGSPVTDGRLAAARPQWRERIQPNRHSLGGPITVFVLSQAAAGPIVQAAPAKIVDLAFVRLLTRSQLELFIDVSCQGDGWHYSTGRLDIWQRRSEALEAYELALILSGRMVTTTTSGEGTCISPWAGKTTIRPMKGRDGTLARAVRSYTGTIWCPTTPNRTWLARRNGTVYFTGNSAWGLAEEEVKMTFSPLAETICGALTKGYLQPMLRQAGLSPVGPNGGKLIVWYDVSELTARPDKSDAVVKAYDRLEASGAALRRELGLDEADNPTPDELEDMVWKKVAGTVELAPTVAGQLSGNVNAPVAGVAVPAGPSAGSAPPPPAVTPATGPPQTQGVPPPPPDQGLPASGRIQRVLVAAGLVEAPPRPARYNGAHRPRR